MPETAGELATGERAVVGRHEGIFNFTCRPAQGIGRNGAPIGPVAALRAHIL